MSGCYRCGSPHGNDARLCPECNAAKLERSSQWRERSPYANTSQGTALSSTSITVAGAAMLLVLLGAFAWVFQSQIRAYTGTMSTDDIYTVCLKAVQKQQPRDEIGQAIMAQAMPALCSEMRNICTNAPDSPKCRQIREAVTRMARR